MVRHCLMSCECVAAIRSKKCECVADIRASAASFAAPRRAKKSSTSVEQIIVVPDHFVILLTAIKEGLASV